MNTGLISSLYFIKKTVNYLCSSAEHNTDFNDQSFLFCVAGLIFIFTLQVKFGRVKF